MGGCSQILSGLAKDCGPSMGGVRKVFIRKAPFFEGLSYKRLPARIWNLKKNFVLTKFSKYSLQAKIYV